MATLEVHDGRGRVFQVEVGRSAPLMIGADPSCDIVVDDPKARPFHARFRRSEGELAWCAANRIAFLPWSPLGGIGRGRDLGGRHRAFAEVAEAHGVSPQQVALAWELAKGPVVIPIPGSSRPETILDSAAAATLRLGRDELARLDRI